MRRHVPWTSLVIGAVGRRVFGGAALILGSVSLILHADLILRPFPGDAVVLFVTSVALIGGGLAMQFRKTAAAGATILGVVYALSALSLASDIFAKPAIYASWGNVFYQLALVAGAIVANGSTAPSTTYAKAMCNGAVMLFGLCNISFAVEQVEFLGRTVALVPRWIPPNGMFWAVATTIAFGLAGVAMLTGYKSLLGARLLTIMLVIFGVAIWIPMLIVDPGTHSNWSEGIETFAIAGTAWVVAEFLVAHRRQPAPKGTF